MCPKKLQRKWLQKTKTTAFHFVLGAFFQFKALQAPFLPKFPRNLHKFPLIFPKRTEWKHDLQKKRLHFNFGCHFCKITPCTSASYPSWLALHEEVDRLHIGGQHGWRFVFLHNTHKPQRRPYPICISRSGNAWHRCREG